MRLQRIQELIYHRPWLITPSGHEAIRAVIERKLGQELVESERAGLFEDLFVQRPAMSIEGGVATIHIMGAIGIGMSKIEKTCGNTDVADLRSELRSALQAGAEKVMLIVDSPGGTVGGVPELADEIANLPVPCFAYVPAGAMNCSAAYYLTAGADRMYASSSADIGSIGVYLPWIDRSASLERAGYKVDLITNKEGDLKGAGFPGTSLSESQRADWQQGVQQIFDDFAAHVTASRKRGTVETDTMRGQSFLAKDAKARNLIDGVVPYESALRTLKRFKREGN
jgi:ClpP class serine protease